MSIICNHNLSISDHVLLLSRYPNGNHDIYTEGGYNVRSVFIKRPALTHYLLGMAHDELPNDAFDSIGMHLSNNSIARLCDKMASPADILRIELDGKFSFHAPNLSVMSEIGTFDGWYGSKTIYLPGALLDDLWEMGTVDSDIKRLLKRIKLSSGSYEFDEIECTLRSHGIIRPTDYLDHFTVDVDDSVTIPYLVESMLAYQRTLSSFEGRLYKLNLSEFQTITEYVYTSIPGHHIAATLRVLDRIISTW